MRRLAPLAVSTLLIAGFAGHAQAQDHVPAIHPAPPGTTPIEPGSKVTYADLEGINARVRDDEDRLTVKRDAELHRENGQIVGVRPALRFNAYPYPRMENFARLFGWRRSKQQP